MKAPLTEILLAPGNRLRDNGARQSAYAKGCYLMEITFNESFASSLTQALNQPVIGLPLDLQVGSLHRFSASDDPFWTLKARYATRTTDYFTTVSQKIAQVKTAIAAGEPLRVWWSETPDDLSGFYWLCEQLKGQTNQLTQIKVPMTAPKIGETLGFREWANLGELDVDEIPQYLPTTKEVSLADRQVYEYVWNSLLAENAPVRATVNGHLIGVSEDFYDGLLMVPAETKWSPVRIVGETLGQYPIGVPDWWYLYRLDQLAR